MTSLAVLCQKKFAFLSDLEDIVLRTVRKEKQLKDKPVELGSDETIGNGNNLHHLRAQERQFFGPKPPCPLSILYSSHI